MPLAVRRWYSPRKGLKRTWDNAKWLARVFRQVPIREWPALIREASRIMSEKNMVQSEAAKLRALESVGFKREAAQRYLRALNDPELEEKLRESQRIVLDEFRPGLAGMFANGITRAMRQARYERWYRAMFKARIRLLKKKRDAYKRAKLAVENGVILNKVRVKDSRD